MLEFGVQEYIGGPTDYYNYTVCDDDDPSGARPPCDDTSTVSYTHLTLPTKRIV